MPTTLSRRSPFLRRTILAALSGGAAAALTLSAVATVRDDDAGAETRGKGRIIDAPSNLRQFSPPESSVAVDASTVSLRQVLTDLGPVATTWYQHVQTLSNPYFEGRVPGSPGMERAADYLEYWYRQAGLEPAFPAPSAEDDTAWTSYRQTMELPGRGVDILMAEATVADGALEPGRDFIVLGCSGKGVVEAPLAFVGYGLEEGQDGYTSFDDDADLSGRIAVVFRYEPMDEEGQSLWSDRRFSRFAAIRPKLDAVAARGAAGLILVNPPDSKHGRSGLDSTSSTRFGGAQEIPMIQLSQDAADTLLREVDPEGRSLMDWRRLADSGEVGVVSFDDTSVRLATDVSPRVTRTDNVGGVLRGQGDLADEWIIIGGHYDHVGMGYFGTDPRNRGQLHPGADDNASGTAAVIILADRLAQAYELAAEDANLRSILFMGFTAEESGLEGSRHYVQNPTLSADQINLMINLDMIGRLRNDTLSVGGVGSAEGFDEILRSHFEDSGLTVATDPSGRGPSDHANFYGAGVPVLFAFTGLHAEYHSPLDTAETVNPAGAAVIIGLLESIVLDMASSPERLVFSSTDSGPGNDRGYASVRLGITPSFDQVEGGTGVLVEAVADDTTAADAGVVPGDVLIGWNGEEIDGAGALMENLRSHKPGDVVQLVILRDGERVVLNATMKASDQQQGGRGGRGGRGQRAR